MKKHFNAFALTNMEFETTIEYAPTTDGWKLAFTRYRPLDFDKNKPPIILCHGFASNRYDLDFEEEKYSLAKYLAKRGFDSWVLELRGHGRSKKRGIRNWFNWSLDTYIDHDAPDAIRYIREKYRKEYDVNTKIIWIGHSMGGMIAYGYGCSEERRKNLKGVVTIASPVKFEGLFNNLRKIPPINLQGLVKFPQNICPPRLNKPFLTPLYVKLIKNIVEKFFVNKDNIDNNILNKFWEKGTEIISCKKLFQFAYMIELNDFCKFPKYPRICRIFFLFCPKSYIKNLKKFVVPLLAIAGNGDNVAVKEDIFEIKKLVGSKDITLKLFSKDNSSADYGHLDLVLGYNSEREVFKEIYEWLEKHL